MAVDLTQDKHVQALADRIARFVREAVIPVGEAHDGVLPPETARVELQEAARGAGVFAPHASPAFGGYGLDMRARAAVFEEAGYPLPGPIALNIAAPVEGNVRMLERIGSKEQKARYPAPLAAGDVRSCFAMTEPAPAQAPTPMRCGRPHRRSTAAGGSTDRNGSSPEPTVRRSRSSWPAAPANPATAAAPRCSWSTRTTRE